MSNDPIRIVKVLKNKVLQRRQIVLSVSHPADKAPSRVDLEDKIAKKLSSSKDLIILFGIKTIFGGGKTTAFGHVYDNKDAMLKVEPAHRLKKKGHEKKKAFNRRTRKNNRKVKAKVWGSGERRKKHIAKRQLRRDEQGAT